MSPKYIILMVCVFVSIIVIAFLFFRKNYIKYNDEIKVLITKEIKGTIKDFNNESRGSYYIEIKTEKENFKIHSLPIAWEIKEYGIQIGDNVSKEENSKTITFYKLQNGVYKKICDFNL